MNDTKILKECRLDGMIRRVGQRFEDMQSKKSFRVVAILAPEATRKESMRIALEQAKSLSDKQKSHNLSFGGMVFLMRGDKEETILAVEAIL